MAELEVHWCLPLFPDMAPGAAPNQIEPTLDYHRRIVHAADAAGFTAILIGAGFGEYWEAFTTASFVLQQTRRLKALVAVRPGYYSAPVAAKLAASVDQQSAGRCLLNVVTGSVPSDLAQYGDDLPHDDRYARTREFIELVRLLWTADEPLDYDGTYYRCERAWLPLRMVGAADGRIYMGGASAAAQAIAAQYSDTYLMFGEPPASIRRQIVAVTRQVPDEKEAPRYGVRINVIARRSASDAWAAANRLLSEVPPETRARMHRIAAETDSTAQARMFALSGHTFADSPSLWTGMARLRVGSGTALVGSYDEVRDALLRYVDAGVQSFILAGVPHLDECRRIGSELLPRLTESTG